MRRTNGLKAPGSINANSLADQYTNNGEGGFFHALLWAPGHKTNTRILTIAKSYLMEYLASTILFFLVVFSVVSAINAAPTDAALRSIMVALVAGGSYFMITGWLRQPEDELPRHGGWNVTLSYALVLRFGLVHTLAYMVMQLLGALTASGLLSVFGFGASTAEAWIPSLGDTVSRAWAAELIGSILIVFSLLYNHMAGINSDKEDSLEKEHTTRRDGEIMASVMRGVATLVFFRLGHWTFDPALYLAGLFTTCWNGGCLSDTNALHLSFGFYMGAPLIGMLIAVLFYILGVMMSTPYGVMRKAKKGLMRPVSAEHNIHTQYSKTSE